VISSRVMIDGNTASDPFPATGGAGWFGVGG
jgi:hypothetical protein